MVAGEVSHTECEPPWSVDRRQGGFFFSARDGYSPGRPNLVNPMGGLAYPIARNSFHPVRRNRLVSVMFKRKVH